MRSMEAVDEGDEGRGPSLSHNVRMFYVSLGEFGQIGVEYWVLESPTQANKRPSAAFVNPAKPLILSLNGQNHGEMPQSLVKKDADFPYLALRLICHIDCNSLTPTAKRQLFVSNRETARGGAVYQIIESEIVRILKSDDELERLNNEAREHTARQHDEEAVAQMRREVARLLRAHGLDVSEPVGAHSGGQEGTELPTNRPPRHPNPPVPITLREPPTYIRWVWDDTEPVSFYPEQRRYVRIETDANSSYHNADNPSLSRINIAVIDPSIVGVRGSTPLQGGRMRAILEAPSTASIGQTGSIRVELTRTGFPALVDERSVTIVPRPPAAPHDHRISLPPFDVRPVEPNSEMWVTLGWPDEVNSVASSAVMEGPQLVVYYSTAFPKYASQRADLERRNAALSASFTRRYEIWLVTHSLLLHQDQTEAANRSATNGEEEESERQERCRMATVATLFARREVQFQGNEDTD